MISFLINITCATTEHTLFLLFATKKTTSLSKHDYGTRLCASCVKASWYYFAFVRIVSSCDLFVCYALLYKGCQKTQMSRNLAFHACSNRQESKDEKMLKRINRTENAIMYFTFNHFELNKKNMNVSQN